jgi:hypothetical protein
MRRTARSKTIDARCRPLWISDPYPFDYAENDDYSEEFNLLNCLKVRGLLAGDAKNYPAGEDDYWCSAH